MLHYKNLSVKDIEGEEWKYIPGWEYYYMASNLGRIKGVQRITGVFKSWPEKIISQHISNNGYLVVGLYKYGNGKTCTVHRLVAKTFILNPFNLKFVNHKKGDRFDNRVLELEWSTKSQNERHKYSILGVKGSRTGHFGKYHNRSKAIAQIDVNGNIIKKFECAREASEKTGVSRPHISSHLNGIYKTAKGLYFKYI